MNLYFLVAACLAFILGLIHSVLGEMRIFQRSGEHHLFSSSGRLNPEGRQARILRVTWHVVTLFGWGYGAILLWMSQSASPNIDLTLIEMVMILSFLAAALLTLFGTKGRHPGWIVLLIIAVLVWLG